MILRGKRTPAKVTKPEEFFLFYIWATQSETTAGWYGDRYNSRQPSLNEFRNEWQSFAENSQLGRGRSLTILADGKPIGQINYHEIKRICHAAEIDVLIGEDLQKGKGYGAEVLRTLIQYLFRYMHMDHCELNVMANNTKAIQEYLQLGFESVVSFVENDIFWQKMVLDKNVFFHQPLAVQA